MYVLYVCKFCSGARIPFKKVVEDRYMYIWIGICIYVCLYVCISYLCKVGMVILYLPLKKKIKNIIMLYDPIHTYTITYILLILYTLLYVYTTIICYIQLSSTHFKNTMWLPLHFLHTYITYITILTFHLIALYI